MVKLSMTLALAAIVTAVVAAPTAKADAAPEIAKRTNRYPWYPSTPDEELDSDDFLRKLIAHKSHSAPQSGSESGMLWHGLPYVCSSQTSLDGDRKFRLVEDLLAYLDN